MSIREYKVLNTHVYYLSDAEKLMNNYAKEGWRVIQFDHKLNEDDYSICITFEREK